MPVSSLRLFGFSASGQMTPDGVGLDLQSDDGSIEQVESVSLFRTTA